MRMLCSACIGLFANPAGPPAELVWRDPERGVGTFRIEDVSDFADAAAVVAEWRDVPAAGLVLVGPWGSVSAAILADTIAEGTAMCLWHAAEWARMVNRNPPGRS